MNKRDIYIPSPHEANVQSLEKLANTLDAQFKIPGTKFSIGVDAIIGLIPGVGDTVSLGLSGLYIAQGVRMKLRKRDMAKMSFNIGIDWLIGLVPLIGDIFDIGWKANIRNAKILREALEHNKI